MGLEKAHFNHIFFYTGGERRLFQLQIMVCVTPFSTELVNKYVEMCTGIGNFPS
jgi:hypothetical protein